MNSKGYTVLDAERIKNCKTCNGQGVIDVAPPVPFYGSGPICDDCDPCQHPDPEDTPEAIDAPAVEV